MVCPLVPQIFNESGNFYLGVRKGWAINGCLSLVYFCLIKAQNTSQNIAKKCLPRRCDLRHIYQSTTFSHRLQNDPSFTGCLGRSTHQPRVWLRLSMSEQLFSVHGPAHRRASNWMRSYSVFYCNAGEGGFLDLRWTSFSTLCLLHKCFEVLITLLFTFMCEFRPHSCSSMKRIPTPLGRNIPLM